MSGEATTAQPDQNTAVITIVSGRHDHLRNQQRGLLVGTRRPDHYVVVAMDDPAALRLTETGPLAGSDVRLHQVRISSTGSFDSTPPIAVSS